MPANILNLPSYRITKVTELNHDYHVHAEVAAPITACIHCQSDKIVGFGRRERLIKDIPMHGQRVGIYVDARRIQCRGCDKTFYEILPDVAEGREMTARLAKWIGEQSLKRPFLAISEETGIDEKSVRNIFRDYVAELEKTIKFDTPKWLGIDEIYLIKPRCVITNIQNRTIVDMLVNRNKDTVAKYLFRLEERKNIQYVAMDMWQPYKEAVRAVLPDARIVVDKFHVVRMANVAMESVRKATRAELTLKQRRGLMHDRFVLLKREHDLNDKEALLLSGWTSNYPLLGMAHRLKEEFYGIWDAPDHYEALQAYKDWTRSIPTELEPHFQPILTAFNNWLPEIMGYFEHPITNAYTESLNNLVRVMNRSGRGYSFEALRAKMLFTEGLHKHKQSRPKFEKRPVKEKIQIENDELMLIPSLAAYSMSAPAKPLQLHQPKPPKPYVPEKNYGVDMESLIAMLERGEI